jgi:hypothetical protein
MSTILEVGPPEFLVGPTSLSAITLASDPDRYRSGFIALRQLNGWPIHDAYESIGPCGFARRPVIPGLRGKCVHSRSPNAGTSVNIARLGSSGSSGVMPRVHMSLASHCRSSDRGGDQGSRQEFSYGHSISPLDMRGQRRWPLVGNGETI